MNMMMMMMMMMMIHETRTKIIFIVYDISIWIKYRTVREGATRRKVAGSIPGSVTEIFHWHNPSGRTMALRYTQPLTEMSTRNISWGVKTAGE